MVIAAAFEDPVLSAQATFRGVLDATARPGTITQLRASLAAPKPLATAAAAIALTLCDQDTPIWLDRPLRSSADVTGWLRFHTGGRIIDEPDFAAFAFVSAPREMPPFAQFNLGTSDYPDRSTTIVLQVGDFRAGPNLVLSGPGIRGERNVRASPLPDDFVVQLAANRRRFPCGIDLLLATETQMMALPRSLHVTRGDD
jgi:alpha-D-ribose 1-methylphosphonate 5-triphosphate synthase subunit PhnH